jgi:alkylation response protein AidB-like acyl-CoA dehydrogenase
MGAPPARRLSAHAQGLGFNLSEDQKAFQIAARDFAREVIIPQAAELDRTMKFPHDVFDKAWEMGLANCHIPEEYGGLVCVCVRVIVCVSGCVIGGWVFVCPLILLFHRACILLRRA